MTETKCASSLMMTRLLTWRNPQGSEENIQSDNQRIENGLHHAGKVISTELGLGLLIITSIVETVTYSALTIASLALYPFTDKPCAFFAKLLQSSAFTIIWGLVDAIIYNPLVINVVTKESSARLYVEEINPIPSIREWLLINNQRNRIAGAWQYY